MSLVRIKDRRTITLTNFTFAAGEVRLVHPMDIPYSTFLLLLESVDGPDEYIAFSVMEGVTSPEDAQFLAELSPAETVEFLTKVSAVFKEDSGSEPPAFTAKGLSPEEEDLVKKFGDLLGGIPSLAEEPNTDDEGDDEEPPR